MGPLKQETLPVDGAVVTLKQALDGWVQLAAQPLAVEPRAVLADDVRCGGEGVVVKTHGCFLLV